MTNWSGHSQRGFNPVFLVQCLELGCESTEPSPSFLLTAVDISQTKVTLLRRKGPMHWWTGSHGNKCYPVLYPDIHLRVDSGRFLKHTHTHMNPTQKIMEIICSVLMYKPIIYGKMGEKSLRKQSQVLWWKFNCTQSTDWKRWGWKPQEK